MKKLSNKYIIFFLIAMNIVGLIYFGARYLVNLQRKTSERSLIARNAANFLSQAGYFTEEDGVTLIAISDKYDGGANPSDEDVAWLLSKIQNSDGRSGDDARYRRFHTNAVLRRIFSRLSPSQKNKMYDVMEYEISLDDVSNYSGDDVIWPSRAMAVIDGKRALSTINRLTKDKRKAVRENAQDLLDALMGKPTKKSPGDKP